MPYYFEDGFLPPLVALGGSQEGAEASVPSSVPLAALGQGEARPGRAGVGLSWGRSEARGQGTRTTPGRGRSAGSRRESVARSECRVGVRVRVRVCVCVAERGRWRMTTTFAVCAGYWEGAV